MHLIGELHGEGNFRLKGERNLIGELEGALRGTWA